MSTMRWFIIFVLMGLSCGTASATGWRKDSSDLTVFNRRLKGTVVDHTANHGKDNRIWSRSLYQRRDLYIYLPPGYDRTQRYPLIIWLHGFSEDEQSFLHNVAPIFDDAMSSGRLPPAIVVCPDGSLNGDASFWSPGSFFLNTKAGAFEDFVLQDMWDFVCKHYPIRHEREAHVLAGASMGGFAAFNYGIKHRNAFGVAMGVFPPLNLRWVDKKGNYFTDFDPKNWGWRTDLSRGHEVIARFAGGLITLRLHTVIDPIFGRGPEALSEVMKENPIEMIDAYRLRPGELEMYVAYGGQDQFNIDAQVESFLYFAKWRGLEVGVGYDKKGRHDLATARRLAPGMFEWLAPRLAPYSPPLVASDHKLRR